MPCSREGERRDTCRGGTKDDDSCGEGYVTNVCRPHELRQVHEVTSGRTQNNASSPSQVRSQLFVAR